MSHTRSSTARKQAHPPDALLQDLEKLKVQAEELRTGLRRVMAKLRLNRDEAAELRRGVWMPPPIDPPAPLGGPRIRRAHEPGARKLSRR